MLQRQYGRRQRGISLVGLLFWGIFLACAGVITAKVVPTVMEYYTIQKAVDKIASGNPATVPAARAEFDRIKQVEYSIQSISGADLEITKENEKVRISFAYNREIDLFGPAFLLLKYEGRSR
ncbi:DUF4845 domain-containing protein [Pelomonas sp. SE-A7]|uniref:DUF4845 domain-containing protein n=1 Tax=Pelomonas sp. SE-A7 TaxID=3054953 RepID=UPI00259CA902|nr:DUF4845 domain-containing protein [Pelomonas sp. SE-A7]MDM4767486.1 DUF4845 domain-containing protein [Pelomonas sp. SE-A7]